MSAVEEFDGWASILGTVCNGDDLSREAAASAMTDILSGSATSAQIAGLIVGLRMKGETIEEMTGLALSMLEASESLNIPDSALDIVGTGGSPHRRSHALNVSTMACFIASAAGAVVCKHGNRKASSTSGSFDFLEAIGVGIDIPSDQVEKCVSDIGIGFAFARAFHPAMRFAGPVRAELGIPTVFNVMGPLAHPGRVKRQVIGTATEDLAAKMAPVLKNLGTELAWVVTGAGGLDELTLTGPSLVFEVSSEGIERFELAPEDAGLASIDSADELAGGSPEQNAKIFEAILDGSETGAKRDIVVLNAAAGLRVAGLAGDIGEGVELSLAAISDGSAAQKVAELVSLTASSA